MQHNCFNFSTLGANKMLRYSLIYVLLSIGLVYSDNLMALPSVEEEIQLKWNSYKAQNGMHRSSSLEDHARFAIFRENYMKIIAHNRETDAGNQTYKTAINRFSTLTRAEYQHKLGVKSTQKSNTTLESQAHFLKGMGLELKKSLPSQVSWVSMSTSVKNQRSCGGCWAFAAIGVVETLYAIKTGNAKQLSVQQLIDCTFQNGFNNFACNGGYPSEAFAYIQSYGVLDEYAYPYRASLSTCAARRSSQPKVTIAAYYNAPPGNEENIRRIVASVGPVAVAVDASQWGFEHYSSGIYSDFKCNSNKLNHAVIVVGYGTENGRDYWLIKNSWGPSWGINGYMKLARNQNNMCGVATMASYAIMS